MSKIDVGAIEVFIEEISKWSVGSSFSRHQEPVFTVLKEGEDGKLVVMARCKTKAEAEAAYDIMSISAALEEAGFVS